jgi:hypothetical protein
MIYYSEWDLVFLDIMKNGSNLFVELFKHVLGKEADKPYFIREPQLYISVVRNPYDRLVSQFYYVNRGTIVKEYKKAIHFPFFRKWVKETYENGYDGTDGHLFSQAHIIRYYEHQLPYQLFKMEELIPHQLFFFLDLDDEHKSDIDNKFSEIRLELDNTKHHANGNIKQGIWQTFYDSETIRICNEYFAKDFEAFGYDMIHPSEWETPKRSML